MYLKLPKRVFQSPLIEFVNFEDGTHVNLIKLNKPYANGDSWAVHETTKSIFCSNGMFKDFNSAKDKFNLMVKNGTTSSPIKNRGVTNN